MFTHSFYDLRSQKLKKLLELTALFGLLGSVCVKALSKYVGEIDPKSADNHDFANFAAFEDLDLMFKVDNKNNEIHPKAGSFKRHIK